jgi:hypothetical protein
MRSFLLGVLTGVVGLVLGVVVVLLVAGEPASPRPAPPTRTASPAPPTDLRRGETWLGSVSLDSNAVVTGDGSFSDLQAAGTDVRMTDRQLQVGALSLEATLPFSSAARQIGEGVELYSAGGGRAGLRRTATLLGRTVAVNATGTVSAQGGQLVIEPETVDLGGPGWLDSGLSAAARRLVTIRHTVRGLPEGMQLTRVSVADSGFQAHLEGRDVVLAN